MREIKPFKVAIVGTGYVGLGTAIMLAYLGHDVVGLDVDAAKVDMLRRGQLPIYEPGLAELMQQAGERLRWTTDYAEAIPEADAIFICVGTPPQADGRPDLKYVAEAARCIARNLNGKVQVVVNKSTVPVGTGDWVARLIEDNALEYHANRYFVVSNPEFLREGTAVHDSLYPDRIVVGGEHEEGVKRLVELYAPLLEQSFEAPEFAPRPQAYTRPALVTTSLGSAEMIKYAANAFLALKISFANEVANLCEHVDADIEEVVRGIGCDARIGPRFLAAGAGWGGSCFGKDTAALISTGADYGYDMPILQAAVTVNTRQRHVAITKLQRHLRRLKGKRVAVLGMAFKPGTDDLRDAPAYDCIARLVDLGATVVAHDPIAMDRARREWANLEYEEAPTAQAALKGADAVLVMTEWQEYKDLDWSAACRLMRNRLVIDLRGVVTSAPAATVVERVGRPSLGAPQDTTLAEGVA
ncbi:UDP-glucose dehydrogenase family protein [Deinococcus yavapaiensis]|uniref:UDP-glucose 6-dehydrogenase n=1 Tax=Deinococcus yavapaiensis KR-236 TaxID=694435 RepID=A0A318SB08_9DEIO|nr:UDP-glucose/GDP-mannose dehydrogenase family protein [Deinococcus yavapaiensis]PYE55752.1 UDPglucose 6-dehydrogenase [Deinococcus yavapaiensis KR-236]